MHELAGRLQRIGSESRTPHKPQQRMPRPKNTTVRGNGAIPACMQNHREMIITAPQKKQTINKQNGCVNWLRSASSTKMDWLIISLSSPYTVRVVLRVT